MKKFTSFISMALLLMMSLTLTSCDQDAEIAATLDGTWKGYLETQTQDNHGKYYYSNMAEVTFNSGYNSGDGYWLDKYSNAPWDYVANRIYWRVTNGNIEITFRDTQERAVIRNYRLTDDGYFYGDIEFVGSNAWTSFKFVQTYSPNWDNYYWYGTDAWYGTWNYYGYAKGQQGMTDDEADKQSYVKDDSIKQIRRFPEGK